MIPHPIRLRKPWKTEQLSADRVAYSRRFNSPSGLDSWERVWLEIDRVMVSGEVLINQKPVGDLRAAEHFAADITDFLSASNEIRIEADPATKLADPPPSGSIYITDPDTPLGSPVGEVRLVIRAQPR
jgi:hypothetical protein